jgi:hypothetical protein
MIHVNLGDYMDKPGVERPDDGPLTGGQDAEPSKADYDEALRIARMDLIEHAPKALVDQARSQFLSIRPGERVAQAFRRQGLLDHAWAGERQALTEQAANDDRPLTPIPFKRRDGKPIGAPFPPVDLAALIAEAQSDLQREAQNRAARKPFIGAIVWYNPQDRSLGPYPGMVQYIDRDGTVDLLVFRGHDRDYPRKVKYGVEPSEYVGTWRWPDTEE